MKCSEFRTRWLEIMDTRESIELCEDLNLHMAKCEPCRTEWELACLLEAQFVDLEDSGFSVRVPKDCQAKVVTVVSAQNYANTWQQALEPDPPYIATAIASDVSDRKAADKFGSTRSSKFLSVVAASGLAASMLLAVSLLVLISNRPNSNPETALNSAALESSQAKNNSVIAAATVVAPSNESPIRLPNSDKLNSTKLDSTPGTANHSHLAKSGNREQVLPDEVTERVANTLSTIHKNISEVEEMPAFRTISLPFSSTLDLFRLQKKKKDEDPAAFEFSSRPDQRIV